ncbi:hypothetical protein AX14_013691 [Amanita brunnescens Koide BX004]|nr:hypothetical protein AX14_013691 [Amanita brunnescens Koide BX004]
MLFLHAQLFFLFGTLVAAQPIPGQHSQTTDLPFTTLYGEHLLYYDVPHNAAGFWQRDPEEAKSGYHDAFYVTLPYGKPPDIRVGWLRSEDAPKEDAPIMMEGSLSEYNRDELAKLGKKWLPVPAHLVPDKSAVVNSGLVAYITITEVSKLTLTIEVKSLK